MTTSSLIGETWDLPKEDMMAKSERLYKQISDALGKCPKGTDWFTEYRKYLEVRTICAEVDGWPSPEAFSQINVQKFIEVSHVADKFN